MFFKGTMQSSDTTLIKVFPIQQVNEELDSVRKAKDQMQLWLARDVKCNTKSFCYYISRKRLNKENVSLLLNEADDLVGADMGEADILIVCFASVFTN